MWIRSTLRPRADLFCVNKGRFPAVDSDPFVDALYAINHVTKKNCSRAKSSVNFSKIHSQTFSKQNINLTCAVNTLKFIKTTWEKNRAHQYQYWSSCLVIFIDCFPWEFCYLGVHKQNHPSSCSSAQICGSFSAQAGIHGHIKMHHAHTNVIGLGDSSVWKVPFLPRTVYLFMAPLTVPIITPLVALGERCRKSVRGFTQTFQQWMWISAERRDGSTALWSHLSFRVNSPVTRRREFIFSLSVWFCSSHERTLAGASGAHRPDGDPRPVLAVLAADPCIGLPVAPYCSAVHAGVPGHVLRALHSCQHLPGKNIWVGKRQKKPQ